MKKINHQNLITGALYWSGNIILSLISITFYSFFNHEMNTANILTSIYIFNSLSEPLNSLPLFFTSLKDSLISLSRIEKFLNSKDFDAKQIDNLNTKDTSAISISNCSFGIDKDDKNQQIILSNINLTINKGEFISIIGEVGSGKSSLLNAILNNLGVISEKPTKNIKINGTISYISQNPWILNDTIKNNILFFHEMNEEKYKKVIDICELTQDIQLFPGGDMTEIGEKGIVLSGGQKARLAIARAIYSEADIYLFDDPLSALDAYVGMKIFKEVIINYLSNKTRVIVTHALQYVSFTQRAIYMNQGKIEWFGSIHQLENQEFYKIFVENLQNKKKSQNNGSNENQNTNSAINLSEGSSHIVRITKDEKQKKGRIKMKKYGGIFIFSVVVSLIYFQLF